MRDLVIVAALIGLCGCADTADVFPSNDAAKQMGRPRVEFVRTGVGRGPVTITMPDGEILTGTWTVAFGGTIGMGFSGGRSASAITIGDGNVQFVASGPKTEVLCRGQSSSFGHGAGECQAYEGALCAVSW